MTEEQTEVSISVDFAHLIYMPLVVLYQSENDSEEFDKYISPFGIITNQKHVHSYHYKNLEPDTLYLVKVVQYMKPKLCL